MELLLMKLAACRSPFFLPNNRLHFAGKSSDASQRQQWERYLDSIMNEEHSLLIQLRRALTSDSNAFEALQGLLSSHSIHDKIYDADKRRDISVIGFIGEEGSSEIFEQVLHAAKNTRGETLKTNAPGPSLGEHILSGPSTTLEKLKKLSILNRRAPYYFEETLPEILDSLFQNNQTYLLKSILDLYFSGTSPTTDETQKPLLKSEKKSNVLSWGIAASLRRNDLSRLTRIVNYFEHHEATPLNPRLYLSTNALVLGTLNPYTVESHYVGSPSRDSDQQGNTALHIALRKYYSYKNISFEDFEAFIDCVDLQWPTLLRAKNKKGKTPYDVFLGQLYEANADNNPTLSKKARHLKREHFLDLASVFSDRGLLPSPATVSCYSRWYKNLTLSGKESLQPLDIFAQLLIQTKTGRFPIDILVEDFFENARHDELPFLMAVLKHTMQRLKNTRRNRLTEENFGTLTRLASQLNNPRLPDLLKTLKPQMI
jgi:hypothetical protein